MRPNVDPSAGSARKISGHASLLGPLPLGYNTPTKTNLPREQDLEKAPQSDPNADHGIAYGVGSLGDTAIQGQDGGADDAPGEMTFGRRRSTLKPFLQSRTRDSSRESSGKEPVDDVTASPSRLEQGVSANHSFANSPTSLSLDSQAPLSSLPSTPKSSSNPSFRQYDEDSSGENGSQAIASSEDDERNPSKKKSDSTPQLIMPSIKMPSRRPFTERGKNIRRFKILIAGDSGSSKFSSLAIDVHLLTEAL